MAAASSYGIRTPSGNASSQMFIGNGGGAPSGRLPDTYAATNGQGTDVQYLGQVGR